eukprot:185900-Hanusia_phi.AAC.1
MRSELGLGKETCRVRPALTTSTVTSNTARYRDPGRPAPPTPRLPSHTVNVTECLAAVPCPRPGWY